MLTVDGGHICRSDQSMEILIDPQQHLLYIPYIILYILVIQQVLVELMKYNLSLQTK